jgi:Flp pilus assembly protein TadB
VGARPPRTEEACLTGIDNQAMDIDIGAGLEQEDVEDLVQQLEAAGYHVRGRGRVQLTEAEGAAWTLLLWLGATAGSATVTALTNLVIRWVRRRFAHRQKRPDAVKVILDSSGEVLSEVKIEQPNTDL